MPYLQQESSPKFHSKFDIRDWNYRGRHRVLFVRFLRGNRGVIQRKQGRYFSRTATKFERVLKYRTPSEMAGVAMQTSPMGFVASSWN